ncbi:MAG: protein tyrosine phosphatase family protein [Armatimonadota bacterium]
MITDIRDFLPLTDHLATAGQPTCEQFSDIQAAGYEVVINLVPFQNPNFLAGEPERVTALGLRYIGISVDWGNPTTEDIHCFFDVMDANRGKKVFVHCAANKRASAFVFLYRVLRLNIDEADAEDDMETIWRPEGTWRIFLNEMLSKKPQFIK